MKASGPYRLVRHPMYLGYVTVHIGFLLLSPNLWNLVVYGLSFAIQIVRIRAEERLLGLDPAYAAFQAAHPLPPTARRVLTKRAPTLARRPAAV